MQACATGFTVIAMGAREPSSAILLTPPSRRPAGSWVPMVNLGAVVFMPAIVIIGDSLGGGDAYSFDEIRQAWRNMGSCFLVRGGGGPGVDTDFCIQGGDARGTGFFTWLAPLADCLQPPHRARSSSR